MLPPGIRFVMCKKQEWLNASKLQTHLMIDVALFVTRARYLPDIRMSCEANVISVTLISAVQFSCYHGHHIKLNAMWYCCMLWYGNITENHSLTFQFANMNGLLTVLKSLINSTVTFNQSITGPLPLGISRWLVFPTQRASNAKCVTISWQDYHFGVTKLICCWS